MNIGKLQLEVPSILAPMEAVNCEAFMKTCAKLKAGLVSTQAIESSEQNFYNADALKKIRTPTSFQIMTSKKEIAIELAKQIEGSVDVIDFNFGCPLKNILGKKAGGYLLQYPHLIKRIVEPVLNEVNTPVTIKIRKGFDKERTTFLEIGKLAEEIGVSAITLHARTVRQRYTEKADWEAVQELKKEISIPVIANGDIEKVGHAKYLLERKYADGFMIGRAAKNNPRLFLELHNNFTGQHTPIPTRMELLNIFYSFYKQQQKQSLQQLQDHAIWFVTGHKHADKLRASIRKTKNVEEIFTIYEKYCQD
jgi:tRNA-dihydrouridine synthase B